MGIIRVYNTMNEFMPAMMMVLYQASGAALNIFYKLAANDGMKTSILIAYRSLFATAFIVPLALIIERKRRPKMTWIIACQAFLCGLLGGSLPQNLYAKTLVLTSATFASAMINLIPAITFILALSFGLEKLGFGTAAGKAKLVGTLVCISGAMLLTFYKGVQLNLWSTHVDFSHKDQPHQGGHVAEAHHDHVLGAFLVLCCCFSLSFSLIIQTKMIKNYPCNYSSTALTISMGTIQAVVYALCIESSNLSHWKLGWNVRLVAVLYTGIFASGIMFTVRTWCVKVKGPLYVSVFNPLMLVIVAIAGSLLLDEKLHLGSVLGAAVIVCGLYLVLWGKGKELKRTSQLIVPSNTTPIVSEGIVVISDSVAEANNNNKIKIDSSKGVPSNGIASNFGHGP